MLPQCQDSPGSLAGDQMTSKAAATATQLRLFRHENCAATTAHGAKPDIRHIIGKRRDTLTFLTNMQLQLLLPAILLGLTAVHSAPNVDPVGGQVASRPLAKPVIGNVTTPDGSLLGFHLYNNTKKAGTPVILVSDSPSFVRNEQ